MPDAAAPINVEWGVDNRTTGLRVPVSPPDARRVENRLGGAIPIRIWRWPPSLACGYLGMKGGLKPRDPITGSAYHSPNRIPMTLTEAISEFEECAALNQILGPSFSALYRKIKVAELENFNRVISPWEREHLLLSV